VKIKIIDKGTIFAVRRIGLLVVFVRACMIGEKWAGKVILLREGDFENRLH
jgi:hypothetical protein